MIYLIILSILISISRAYFNYRIIRKLNWHIAQGIFIGLTVFGFTYIYQFECIDKSYFEPITYLGNYYSIGIIMAYILSIHWVLYDISLNLMLNNKWHYYNIEGDSLMDRLGGYQFYIKGFLLFLVSILTIHYYSF